MPGKWGGARRARPPLDPPMKVKNKLLNNYVKSSLEARILNASTSTQYS